MKHFYILIAILILSSSPLKSQDYTFRYNQYSGLNKAQLELALEQANKMERNGKIWTAAGTGMLIGGAVMTFQGINNLSYESGSNYVGFALGLGMMCFSGFPLGYGMVAWITGNERANMIEIELLAFDTGKLNLKPTANGLGLVLEF